MISETMPIAMVSSQPMGSDPGWKSRPSAPDDRSYDDEPDEVHGP